MDDDFEKLAAQFKTFTKDIVDNPYRGIPTFFGLPYRETLADLDLALIGVPFDLGVTDRSGTRSWGPASCASSQRA